MSLPSLTATVQSFDIDMEPHSTSPVEQRLIVYRTATTIAREEHLLIPTNSRTIEGHNEMPPLTLDLGVGKGALSLQFRYDKAMVSEFEALVRIPQPVLRIDVLPDAIARDCSALLARCAEELRGMIEDVHAAIAAGVRIHALTERLLYAILGGRSEWLDVWAYKYARYFSDPTSAQLQ